MRLVLAVVLTWTIPVLGQSQSVPERTDDNLIVAAYNIQFLGERDHDLKKLAKVIQHFDVCGVVELKSETELRELRAALEATTNERWGYVFGVRTHRPQGNYHEAFGALWRRDRVELGDGVVGGLWDHAEEFRNDPFIVSFVRRGFDFSMILLHTRWTNDPEGTRANEVAAIGRHSNWLRQFLPERDILVAGDFNYPGTRAEMKALSQAAGLSQLDEDPKSTFSGDASHYVSSYDHIYANTFLTKEYVSGSCTTLDSTFVVYADNSPESMKLSKSELSDHLPVFAVFDVSKPDDD
ncbi:MAG: endonuclease/exonuclease/phosphatase family protein [Vulcanimicrobiota bacterium]